MIQSKNESYGESVVNKNPRVVITGMGVVSACGIGKANFWDSICKGESGIRRISSFDTAPFSSQWAGEIKDFNPLSYFERAAAKRLDRCTQFSIAAAREALEDSLLATSQIDNTRVGICFGTSVGSLSWCLEQHEYSIKRGFRRINPFAVVNGCYSSTSGHLSLEFGYQGPSMTVCAGSASGASAIILGQQWIRDGIVDVVIAGGGEAPLEQYIYGSFSIVKALAPTNDIGQRAIRPFDRRREGTLIGEGSGMVILESLAHARKRQAKMYAEILATGSSCDAHHLTVHEESGFGISRCINQALSVANLSENEIDVVFAHGTGTPSNDVTETRALKKVFGKYAYSMIVNSIKPYTGHTLGASGALGVTTACLSMQSGVIPQTLNLEEPDPECDLNYNAQGVTRKAYETALCLAYGFGNKNAAIILRKQVS